MSAARVDGGDLGELEGAEQQVVGVGGDVLQLQFIEVRQAGQLLLDVVFGGGQKGQGVAQQRVVRFELFDQTGLFLHRLQEALVSVVPLRRVVAPMPGLNRVEARPEPVHLVHRRHQRVVVVGQRHPGLEDLVFPLRILLFDLPDQVPRFGVGHGLVGAGLEIQKQQDRGQYQHDQCEQQQTASPGDVDHGLPSHWPVRVLRNRMISRLSSSLGMRPNWYWNITSTACSRVGAEPS